MWYTKLPCLLRVQTSEESVFVLIARVPFSDGNAMLYNDEHLAKIKNTKYTIFVDLRMTGSSRKTKLENR